MKIFGISIAGFVGILFQVIVFQACASEQRHTKVAEYRTTPPIVEEENKISCVSQTYSYSIDSRFTNQQKKEIREALQTWTDSTDGMVNFVENGFGLRFVVGKESDLDIQNAAARTLHLERDKVIFNPILGLCYHCFDKEGSIYIKIVTSKPLPQGRTYEIARHEIGHYLGLDDTKVPGTVMTGIIEDGYKGNGISELDKIKFMGIWCK